MLISLSRISSTYPRYMKFSYAIKYFIFEVGHEITEDRVQDIPHLFESKYYQDSHETEL